MVEESGDPTPADARHAVLYKRIEEYIASGKAAQHLQEGFYGNSQLASLNLEEFKKRESRRHSIENSQGELPQGSTPSEEVTDLICIWCGQVCADPDDLDAHEAGHEA